MAVNLKLLHYARHMADVKPEQYREATETVLKAMANSKMIKGLAEDVFESKAFEDSAAKLGNEIKRIKTPKKALKKLTGSFVKFEPVFTISEAQARRMKL